MGEAKSKFAQTGTGYNHDNFLLDSLSFVGEDTRKGFNAQATARMGQMKNWAEQHPDKSNIDSLNGYFGKLQGAAPSEPEVRVAVAQRNKPGNGIM